MKYGQNINQSGTFYSTWHILNGSYISSASGFWTLTFQQVFKFNDFQLTGKCAADVGKRKHDT